jgi:hypothetical protein
LLGFFDAEVGQRDGEAHALGQVMPKDRTNVKPQDAVLMYGQPPCIDLSVQLSHDGLLSHDAGLDLVGELAPSPAPCDDVLKAEDHCGIGAIDDRIGGHGAHLPGWQHLYADHRRRVLVPIHGVDKLQQSLKLLVVCDVADE